MMCSSSFVLAVVGHYVPGIMIFYIIGLSVILWPLVVYHEVIQRMYTGLEPILMKLDYSMKGETERRKHDKKKVKKEPEEGDEPSAETESESENELSRFAPTVDVKTTALAMAITDSELSDEEASILESGGFSVSRATTPQLTDVSEDLDQPSLHGEPDEPHLTAEIPSVERGLLLRVPQGDRSRSGAGPVAGAEAGAPQNLASPLHFVNTHFNGHGKPSGPQTGAAPRSLEALSEEIVSTAISAVVRNTLSTLLRSGEEDRPEPTARDPPTNPEPTDPEEEEEDFELLDQSELEQAGAPGTGTPPLRRPS
ncbi:reticulophagy regulator 2-like [Stigmatopora argus]